MAIRATASTGFGCARSRERARAVHPDATRRDGSAIRRLAKPARFSGRDTPHLGLSGIRVDTADAVAGAWDQALSSDRPVVLEAITDPNVPPLPPHITLEQAKNFASAVLSRDADALGFLKQTVKDTAAGLWRQRSDPELGKRCDISEWRMPLRETEVTMPTDDDDSDGRANS